MKWAWTARWQGTERRRRDARRAGEGDRERAPEGPAAGAQEKAKGRRERARAEADTGEGQGSRGYRERRRRDRVRSLSTSDGQCSGRNRVSPCRRVYALVKGYITAESSNPDSRLEDSWKILGLSFQNLPCYLPGRIFQSTFQILPFLPDSRKIRLPRGHPHSIPTCPHSEQ